MTEPRTAIGIDIGGTKIAAGVVDEDGDVVTTRRIAAPERGAESGTLEVLLDLIADLRTEVATIDAIGVGAAGMVDWPSGYIRWAPNNPYHELPLRDLLIEHTGLSVTVENDANAAAAGEARFGGGVDHRCSLTMTIGTGIGGGIVTDGQILRGPHGIGAEVGHIVVNPLDGPRCNCGSKGCLESVASGTALARDGEAAARRRPTGILAQMTSRTKRVTGEIVFAAAQDGDPQAVKLLDDLAYWLGVGIASLVTLFDPEVVILGGGIMVAAGDDLLRPTTAHFEQFVSFRDHRVLPELLPARLGAQAGFVGAAVLALDRCRSQVPTG